MTTNNDEEMTQLQSRNSKTAHRGHQHWKTPQSLPNYLQKYTFSGDTHPFALVYGLKTSLTSQRRLFVLPFKQHIAAEKRKELHCGPELLPENVRTLKLYAFTFS